MAKKDIGLVRKLIKSAMARCDQSIKVYEGSMHPTHIEFRNDAKSRQAAYEEILRALDGDFVLLRISAGDFYDNAKK